MGGHAFLKAGREFSLVVTKKTNHCLQLWEEQGEHARTQKTPDKLANSFQKGQELNRPITMTELTLTKYILIFSLLVIVQICSIRKFLRLNSISITFTCFFLAHVVSSWDSKVMWAEPASFST